MLNGYQVNEFKPPFGLRGRHSQTIYSSLSRQIVRGVTLQRERLELPDGDFIDIDFAEVKGRALDDTAPMVLFLHGLEGSAESNYAKLLYKLLAEQGIRSVGMNYRSCSGEMNRLPRLYHAGATDDVRYVHDVLLGRYPNVKHGLAGVSLGANMLLKYLGEEFGERSLIPQIAGAVSISPFFNMLQSSAEFDTGSGKWYAGNLLKKLKEKVRLKRAILEPHVDVDAILASKTVREFDNLGTAQLAGFRDADDYYARNSSGQFLITIQTPTLIIRALDDPFFSPNDVPWDTLHANTRLTPAVVKHGGHVGFVKGYTGGWWAGEEAARFLGQQLRE